MTVRRAPARINPPFTLYTLHVKAGTRNDPPEPAVYLVNEDVDGTWLGQDVLTTEQARTVAAELVRAADTADARAAGGRNG